MYASAAHERTSFYTFIREWNDTSDRAPVVIVAELDLTLDDVDRFEDAEFRALAAGQAHYVDQLEGVAFGTATRHVLVVFADISDDVELETILAVAPDAS